MSCFGGNDASISVLGSGGTAPLSYAWSNGANLPDLQNLIAGDYQVTITDANGCSTIASASIAEPPLLYASNFPTNASCFGYSNGGAGTVIIGGTMHIHIIVEYGETTGALSNVSAGTYQVTITDANGCTTTSSTSISSPEILAAQASTSQVSCYSGTDGNGDNDYNRRGYAYLYNWNNGQTTAALTNVLAGNYQVTITDAYGCTTTGSALISEPPALNLLSAATATSCNGYSNGTGTALVSGGTSPYQYLWSNGQTNEQSTNLSAGIYGVTITDSHSCTISTSVTVDQPAALEINTLPSPVSCFNGANGAITTNPDWRNCPLHLSVEQMGWSPPIQPI